jgi:UDPglucose 6-dehydrogenase
MKIGSIGRGMVGEAIFQGLKSLNNEMSYYDPKYKESKMEDILDTDIVFISVPTIPNENNECDLTILNIVFEQLDKLCYKGVICIKSTITPGTTAKMIQKYNNNKICFCPEFLKERCAYQDFMENNPICIIGTESEEVFNIMKEIHGPICLKFKMVKPIEAELTKYMQNVFNTYRILFANGFYEICKHNDVEYNSVLDSLLHRKELDEKYMKCDENIRGPSGPCLVKDSLAFNQYVKNLNLEIKPSIFQTIVNDMELYPKTVIDGTRTEKEYFGKELTGSNK